MYHIICITIETSILKISNTSFPRPSRNALRRRVGENPDGNEVACLFICLFIYFSIAWESSLSCFKIAIIIIIIIIIIITIIIIIVAIIIIIIITIIIISSMNLGIRDFYSF